MSDDPHDGRPYRERGPIRGPVLIATGGVLLALGMTMNWVRAAGGEIAWSGLDLSGGSQVFGFAAAAMLVVLGAIRSRISAIAAIALSFAIGWRGLLILRDGVRVAAGDRALGGLGEVSYGPGTWLVFASALCALAGGLVLLAEIARAERGDRG